MTHQVAVNETWKRERYEQKAGHRIKLPPLWVDLANGLLNIQTHATNNEVSRNQLKQSDVQPLSGQGAPWQEADPTVIQKRQVRGNGSQQHQ